MAKETTTAVIEKQEWLDTAAEQGQKAISAAYEGAGEAGQKVKNFLHGTWLGHPLHSAVTDVPVGAWTAAVVLDAMSDVTGKRELQKGADAAIAVGLAGAGVSAITGLTDWQSTDGRARQIGMLHGLMNTAGMMLFAASLIARKRDERTKGRGLSMLGFAVAMGAAYLGGKLVYSERVGTDHSVGQKFPENFVRVLAGADLRDGQMRRVEVEGTPIVLARRGEQVFALGEVCSHLGGPLSEGKMEDCTVQCPWHGSRFSLEDGSVIDGPSTHPQPCLEVRVRDGQIEVRRKQD
jgi:nitrite reductase/ring-hydroxylating ferredoxin subunit/uncharacterized membrane protein